MRSTRVLLLAVVAVAAVAMLSVHGAPTGQCRALAMAGGGDKAAYEAGVIRGLLDALPPEETAYNVVTGISAGSTLAAAFSVFPVGQERSVADLAETIIAQLNQSSIFRNWPGGVVEGFLKHSSLFDSTPLRDMFNTFLGGRSVATDRSTCFGVSNLRTGRLERLCDEKSVGGVINGAVASAAIPGVFLAQQIAGETYVDGGVTMNVDVIGAVLQCMKLGYPEESIIVDTIQCGGVNLAEMAGDLTQLTVLPILLRAAQMLDFADSQRAFVSAVEAFPAVNFRYRIMPTQPIAGSGIDFNRTGRDTNLSGRRGGRCAGGRPWGTGTAWMRFTELRAGYEGASLPPSLSPCLAGQCVLWTLRLTSILSFLFSPSVCLCVCCQRCFGCRSWASRTRTTPSTHRTSRCASWTSELH